MMEDPRTQRATREPELAREDSVEKSLQIVTHDLRQELQEFECDAMKKVISDRALAGLRQDLESRVKRQLENLFGPESNIREGGSLHSLINFHHVDGNRYRENVLFAYWSSGGDRDTYIREAREANSIADSYSFPTLSVWRENLFYKGKRWSNEELKQKFYFLYKPLSSAANKLNPLNEITRLACIGRVRGHLKIELSEEGFVDSCDGIIRFPSLEHLIDSDVEDGFASTVKQFKDALREQVDSDYLKEFVDRQSKRDLGALLEKSISYLRSTEATEVDNWAESLLNALGAEDMIGNGNWEMTAANLLRAQFIYQYFDHPFDVHLFVPHQLVDIEDSNAQSTNMSDNDLRSCLIVTTGVGDIKLNPYAEAFAQLAQTLSLVPLVERNLWRRWIEQSHDVWRWREHYSDWEKRYERLMSIAEDLVKGICKKYGIVTTQHSLRLKGFSSFFDKLAKRANDPREENSDEYRARIRSGGLEDFTQVTKMLKDIAGLRVVCVYEDDVVKLTNILKRNFRNETVSSAEGIADERVSDLITIVKLAPHPDKSRAEEEGIDTGYRATHVTFRLGPSLTNCPAYEDLRDLQCELQIRSALSDGHSWASHELVYKPKKGFEHDSDIAEIANELKEVSSTLKMCDKRIVEKRKSLRD